MDFLIDTNVFIQLEPYSSNPTSNVDAESTEALAFASTAHRQAHRLFVHPAQRWDIENDKDATRKRLRQLQYQRYPELQGTIPLHDDYFVKLGNPPPYTNDWVDNQLLAAVAQDAVHWLVTQDRRIHSKAVRIGVEDRVLTVDAALRVLSALWDGRVEPPPTVKRKYAYELDPTDPIFDSLRADYPGFDAWFRKAKLQHRYGWVIENGQLAAVTLVKTESDQPYGLKGKVLKISTFKVSPRFGGYRYGELLLKTVFNHATENSYDWLYVEMYPKHVMLGQLLAGFGFEEHATSDKGELVLAKPMQVPDGRMNRELDHFTFHVRYGPQALHPDSQSYVVPIRPAYHRMLFPEAEPQLSLSVGKEAFGNSINKAYLCHFYRSRSQAGVRVLGVAERVFVSQSPEEIAAHVAKRSVYSFPEISRLCERRVLVIMFRQAVVRKNLIPARELLNEGVLRSWPQSVVRLRQEGSQWMRQAFGVLP